MWGEFNFQKERDHFLVVVGTVHFSLRCVPSDFTDGPPNNSFSDEEEIHNGCRSRYHYSPDRWWDRRLQGSGSSDHSYDDLVLRLLIGCFPTAGTWLPMDIPQHLSPFRYCERNKILGRHSCTSRSFRLWKIIRVYCSQDVADCMTSYDDWFVATCRWTKLHFSSPNDGMVSKRGTELLLAVNITVSLPSGIV